MFRLDNETLLKVSRVTRRVVEQSYRVSDPVERELRELRAEMKQLKAGQETIHRQLGVRKAEAKKRKRNPPLIQRPTNISRAERRHVEALRRKVRGL
jgi:hypothetical protein